MNYVIVSLIIFLLLSYVYYGFLFWMRTQWLGISILANDTEKIKVFVRPFDPSRRRYYKRMLFLAKVKKGSLSIRYHPLMMIVYPLYMRIGWTPLMYSCVFAEEKTSEYLEEWGMDVNMKDLFGQDAHMLREVAKKQSFKKYKMPEEIQMKYRNAKGYR